eukprot:scaffold31254_cov124-Isochrysis_galbana.AAC.2
MAAAAATGCRVRTDSCSSSTLRADEPASVTAADAWARAAPKEATASEASLRSAVSSASMAACRLADASSASCRRRAHSSAACSACSRRATDQLSEQKLQVALCVGRQTLACLADGRRGLLLGLDWLALQHKPQLLHPHRGILGRLLRLDRLLVARPRVSCIKLVRRELIFHAHCRGEGRADARRHLRRRAHRGHRDLHGARGTKSNARVTAILPSTTGRH